SAAYDLFIGKKDGNQHKVILSKLGVEKASATITGQAIPHNTGRNYWVAWYDNRVFVGIGSEVGNLNNTILSYDTSSDVTAAAPVNVRRFSFTSGTGIISYRNIRSHPFSMVKEKIDAQEQTASDEAGTVAQWHGAPAAQTIMPAYARRLYWHPQRSFTTDEPSASVMFTIKKPVFAEKALTLIALGNAPAPTTPDGSNTLMAKEDYANATYVIGLRPDGTVQLLKKTGDNIAPVATSPSNDKVKELNNGQPHNVWLNYENGSFKLGIDSSLGVEPVWEHTDAGAPSDVRFVAFGTGGNTPPADYVAGQAVAAGQAAKIELTNIEVRAHYDPTKYLTPSAEASLQYQWRSDWRLPYPNNGTISFTMQPHANTTSSVMASIGLGPDTLPANQPTRYAGAVYNILMNTNARVQVLKGGDVPNIVHRESGVTAVRDALTDGKAHTWWLTFANRTIMLGVDTTPGMDPVFSWTDPISQRDETDQTLQQSVQHFSFSSANGQLLFTNITIPQQEAAKSLQNELQNFEDLLITNPAELLNQVDRLISEQVHRQDMGGFIGTLSMISKARELLPKSQRTLLGQLIEDTKNEPGLSSSQESLLGSAQSLLTSAPTIEELAGEYLNELEQSSILTLEQAAPARKLFMYKLARLADETKVKPEKLHIALDASSQESNDKLGTLLAAIAPVLNTEEPQKITEDERFSETEHNILQSFALRVQKERTALRKQTTAYKLENIQAKAGIATRLIEIRNHITEKRNDTNNVIEYAAGDFTLLLNTLRSIVDNRWQLPKTITLELKGSDEQISSATPAPIRTVSVESGPYLMRTLKAASFMPGIHTDEARKAMVDGMIADLADKISFADRLERTKELMIMYEAATSTNPGRIEFFNETLPRLLETEVASDDTKSLDEYFSKVLIEIITPLQNGPLSPEEMQHITKALQIIERRKNEQNQFSARMTRALERSQSLFEYVEKLRTILSEKDDPIVFGESDYDTFVSALYDVVMNRELLNTMYISEVQLLVEKARFIPGFDATKKYIVGPNKESEITLDELKIILTEPYSFAARVAYAIELTRRITSRPAIKDENDTIISDPLMRRLIEKLRVIKGAPNESTSQETEELFEALERDVFMYLLSSNRIAENDREQLKQIRTVLIDEKEELIRAQKTFSHNFNLAQKLRGNIDSYTKQLRNIITGIRLKRITFTDEDVEVIRNEIMSLIERRDELSSTLVMKQMITTMQSTELATLIPEMAVSEKDDLNTFERQLLPENAYQYNELVTKYAQEARDIPSLPVYDGIENENDEQENLRSRFFAKLKRLSNAPGDRSAASLKEHLEMLRTLLEELQNNLQMLEQVDNLSDTQRKQYGDEITLVNEQIQVTQEVAKSQDTVKYRLFIADKNNVTFFEYAQALDEMMKDKDEVLTFNAADYQSFANAIAYLVGNREVLDEDQRTFVRSMLDSILNQFEDLQGNPINAEAAPELFASGFGPSAMKLFLQREKLATAHEMKHRIQYAGAELRAFRSQSLPLEHARFQRFIQKVSVITDAPGIKEETEFRKLKMFYESLQRYLARNDFETDQVARWLEELPARQEEALTQQKDFSYQFDQAKKQKKLGGTGPYITELKEIALRKQNAEVTFKASDYIRFYEALKELTDGRDALSRTEWFLLRKTAAIANTKNFVPDEQLQKDFADLNELVKELPDFNTKVKKYVAELEDIKGEGTKSERRRIYYKKLSNVVRLPGFKDVARIDDLIHITEELLPFASSEMEKQTLTTLALVIVKEKAIASTLSYQLARMQKEVSAARDTGQDYVGILIANLNDIVAKKGRREIVFVQKDYGDLVKTCRVLLDIRELLTSDQVSDVQSLCNDLQMTPGFEEFDVELSELKTAIATQLSFEERLKKYERQFNQINRLDQSEAVNDMAKGEFVSMISSILKAPGDRSPELMERLKTLVGRVTRGNFSEIQKAELSGLESEIAEAVAQVNSFSYRLERIKQSATPKDYYHSLETLIDDVSKETVTVSGAERSEFVTLLNNEARKRPLIRDMAHPLLVTIDKAKITPAFGEAVSELDEIASRLTTDASLTDRITAISRQLPSLLRRQTTDGERRRFFIELETFTNNLSMLPGERLTLDIKEVVANATSVIARYKHSANATESEKELIEGAVAQLTALNTKIDEEENKRIDAEKKAEEERLAVEQAEAEKAKRQADIQRQQADKAIRRQNAISAASVKTNLTGFQRTRVNRRRRRAPVKI
ncbi:MAG: hypothetical protein PVJ92_01105, partial [Candidatus Dependentiae bacterium]